MVEVDDEQIDDAFDELEASLAATYVSSAIRAHVAGDLAAQRKLGIKTTLSSVRKAAEDYGKEYERLLVERGGGNIVENGKFKFKPWFRQSNRENRKAVAKIINDGIKEGKGVRALEKDLKPFFNARKRHAELVARTETAKVQDIANQKRMREQGITKMQWITAEDERVRSAHAARHNRIYDVGEIHIGDPNCRCDLVGVPEDV